MQQFTFRQVFSTLVVLILMAAATWWFLSFSQAADEREKLLQARADQQEKDLVAAVQERHKNDGELKKLLGTLLEEIVKRKPGEPIRKLELAAAPPTADEKALAKSRLKMLESQVQEIGAILEKTEDARIRWDTRVKAVLGGDDGKKLAGNEFLAEQFVALVENGRMSKEAIEKLRKKTLILLEPQLEFAKNHKELVHPGETTRMEMDIMLKESAKGLGTYERDLRTLDTLLADSAHNPIADKTLAAVVLEIKAKRERERAKALVVARKNAIDESTKKLADALADAVKQDADLDIERIAEVGRIEKVRKEFEIAKLAVARKREELMVKFELTLPEFKLYLSPFITNGYAQPDGKNLKKLGKSEPMSYSRLVSAGALRPDRPGLECLLYLGGAISNDRFRGGFPRYIGGEGGWDQTDKVFLQRSQDLLKEFGPVMVEKGLLTP